MITVIGCGRWGSCIAWYLDKIGNDVHLYGRKASKHMQAFQETRSNGMLVLPESVKLVTSLEPSIEASNRIVISVGAQNLRSLLKELKGYSLKNKTFILCMKGIEIGTGERLSQIAQAVLGENNQIAVWLGPGHVQEFFRGIPNCMVIDSDDQATKDALIQDFSSPLIRFYYGDDLIGNEIGAAAKNVIGIAAGMLDGLDLSSLKGALMSRGTREVSRLIAAEGGKERTAYGLCHLGDYEATVFSQFSNNRRFGEKYVKGESFDKLAEGYYTVQALIESSERLHIDLPICQAVYDVLYHKADPRETLDGLFKRGLKPEYW